MRNTFLITAVLFWLATAAVAADQNKDVQQQSQPAEQAQMARNDAGGSTEHPASPKTECPPTTKKYPQREHQQDGLEGDPQAPQNQVEYGGGG